MIRFVLTALVLAALVGCSSRSNNTSAQTQESKDEQTLQKVADATQKAKEESRVAAKNLDEAAHQAAHQAKVAVQGAKEGWNRQNTSIINVNSASKYELEKLPGLSAKTSEEIINNRPYSDKHELVTKGIISEREYNRIADRLAAR